MRAQVLGLFLLCLAGQAVCRAGTFHFAGTFSTDDQVETFSFALGAAGTVTVQSFGYGGGVSGTFTYSPGGFAPNVALFVPVGPDYQMSLSDNGGHCPPTNPDVTTGNCDDPFFQASLPAGSYFLVLSVWDNVPLTGTLSDGYKQTGNPGFTCAEGGVGGSFCDVTDALFRSRTGDWALAISGVDSAADTNAVPEPATGLLLLTCAFLGGAMRRRRIG